MAHQNAIDKFSVIISAAGQVGEDLAAVLPKGEKCAALFGGRPMVSAAIDAAADSGAESVAVVAGDAVRAALGDLPSPCIFAEPGSNPVASAKNGAALLPDSRTIVFLPGDVPLIEGNHVMDFVCKLPNDGSWIAAGVSSREAVEASFGQVPGIRYVKLGGKQFAAGGLFAASRDGFELTVRLLGELAENRKSQMGMAKQFGFWNVLRYFSGTLSIDGAEKAASRVFGCDAKIVTDCAPETILDVDTVEDWNFLKRYEPGATGDSSST